MRKKSLLILPLFIVLIVSGCFQTNNSKLESNSESIVPNNTASTENENNTAKPKQTDVKLPEKEQLDEFVKKIQPEGLKLNKIIHDDIDQDGKQEYIITFGELERIFIARFDGEFHTLGELKDSISVVHHYTDVAIMNLEPAKKFIVLYSAGGYFEQGSGYTIFQLNGSTIEEINSNFPGATGRGARELKDYDSDGIFDSVSYYSLNDVQKHLFISYSKYDNSGSEKIDIKYSNGYERFVYPEKPQDVIQNFIEDFYYKEWLTEELKQFVEDESLINFNMDNYVSFSGMDAYRLDLDIKQISEDKSVKTFAVQSNNEKPEKPKIIFTLSKISSKWKIEKIEPEPDIEHSQIIINGKKIEAKPIQKNNEIYVPMGETFPELGLTPQLNAEYQAYRVNTATSVIFFTVGAAGVSKTDLNIDNFDSDNIEKNKMRKFKEKAAQLKDYPIKVNDTVYIPLTFMKSYLNINVAMDKENNIILSSEKFDYEQNLKKLYADWNEKFGKIGNSYSNTWFVYNYSDFYENYISRPFWDTPMHLKYYSLYYKDAEKSQ